MSKKLLLLSCLMSGVIIGAEKLGQHNCHVIIIRDEAVIETGTHKLVNSLMFFRKGNYDKALFTSDYFDRPIKTVSWDTKKSGFLYINFEDGNKIEFDVNNPGKTN